MIWNLLHLVRMLIDDGGESTHAHQSIIGKADFDSANPDTGGAPGLAVNHLLERRTL